MYVPYHLELVRKPIENPLKNPQNFPKFTTFSTSDGSNFLKNWNFCARFFLQTHLYFHTIDLSQNNESRTTHRKTAREKFQWPPPQPHAKITVFILYEGSPLYCIGRVEMVFGKPTKVVFLRFRLWFGWSELHSETLKMRCNAWNAMNYTSFGDFWPS